jgi:hypothetical protein
MAPSHASRLLVASIVLAFASAGSMPADSIFKVLDDLGEDKGEDSLLSSSSSSCLMLGPFPSSSIPIGFRARCSSVIEVLHDWELDERCMGVQGVYQVAADQQQVDRIRIPPYIPTPVPPFLHPSINSSILPSFNRSLNQSINQSINIPSSYVSSCSSHPTLLQG